MLKKTIGLTAGAAVYSAGISLFLDPHGLAPGGIGGIAIMLSRIAPVLETGTWILLLNIPLLIIGSIVFGRRFLLSTVYTTVASSLMVDVIARLMADQPQLTDNTLLAALAGGAGLSIGMGIVFRSGGTTGGADIVVKLLRRKYRHLRMGAIFMAIDAAVVVLTIPVMGGVEPALYAAVALVVASVLIDKVLYGAEGGTLFYIVTQRPHEIAKRIMDEVDLGVTYLQGEGAYTGAPKRVLLCVARRQLSPRIRDIVKAEDASAFLIVSPASEVLGEGFKAHEAEEP
ncbi:MAG: YitT family protein [Clostridia bacterium]|nr:YitT family protein [Clostridia bacterium]